MEITNENRVTVLNKLQEKGFISLVNDIKETLKINEDNYPIGSDYGIDKGYGIKIFLIDTIKELVGVKNKFHLFGLCVEHDKAIIEVNGNVSHYELYLTGSDTGIVIYMVD